MTVVTQSRANLFGEVVEGVIGLKAGGQMISRWWMKLPGKFEHVAVHADEMVIMPNHIHGIIWINETTTVGADPRVGPENHRDIPVDNQGHTRVRPYRG